MAEVLASAFLPLLFEKLANPLLKKLGLLFGIKKDLRRLESTLSALQAAIEDAEARTVKDSGLTDWLGKLRDVAYDADDILDDLTTEAIRRKVEISNRTANKVWNFFSPSNPIAFNIKMAHRIKGFMEKLDEIAKERSMFHLGERIASGTKAIKAAERRQTHSFVNESRVFGRRSDRELVLQMLIDMDREVDISVIPIVGIGGLGKTTLAQYVYNDGRVTAYFDLRIWVCVSEDFDVMMIAKSMVESAIGQKWDLSDMDPLQTRLQQILSGKRYLLVLDDVWNEEQAAWERLQTLLRGGLVGSKVLVTTRSNKVASIMGTLPAYDLKGLSDDDCWSLFQQRAFQPGEEDKHPHLQAIGKVIVHKCRGVPLAAKSLGSLLRFKRVPREWLSIKDSEVWQIRDEKEILPALQLSYIHLPSHLKQCFSYCSIFPKDHSLKKDELIQQWMAQGFLQCKGTELMEDIGAEYFDELCWRSFFQDVKESVGDDGKTVVKCKMHDLVNDLAKSVAGTECLIMSIAKGKGIEGKTRYSSFVHDENFTTSTNIMPVNKALKVRALISLASLPILNLKFSIKPVNLRCLRALDLSHIHFVNLPPSIGNLKHLRYLNLSKNGWIGKLPSSICSLCNLQTLKLKDCDSLKGLPKDMSKMISLRHLEMSEDVYSSWTTMPPGIGRLSWLQTLPIFIVGKQNGCGIEELQGLRFLGGTLSIRELQNVVDPENAEKATLKEKEKLQSLKLSWSGTSVNIEQVIENLQPHSNLKVLSFENYKGMKFPKWLMDSQLPNLVWLSLNSCPRCQNLPPLQQLSSLKFLELKDMGNLEIWLDAEKGEELPSIKSLIIVGCLKLNSLPWLPSLKTLTMLCSNEKLLKFVASYTSLADLHIGGFPEIELLPEGLLVNHTLLKTVNVSDCPKLKSLPKELNHLSGVKDMQIKNCGDAAASLLEVCVNIRNLKINSCNTLTCWPEQNGVHGEAFASLKCLCIDSCQNLRSLHEQGLQCLTGLELLSIAHCPELSYLLKSIKHLTSLFMLHLFDLPKLEFLPDGMENLTSLQILMIRNCPAITGLPTGLKHLTLLQFLLISDCPQLERRCRRERGEDWHKIQHIPSIAGDI